MVAPGKIDAHIGLRLDAVVGKRAADGVERQLGVVRLLAQMAEDYVSHARFGKTDKRLTAIVVGEMAAGAIDARFQRGGVAFRGAAKKEGYEQIAAIFTETADQEKEHAKRMFKFLEGGMVEITASYPAGVIGNTLENLRAAAAGEHEEWSLDYPHFADVAEQEGFPMIAAMYRNISIAEKGHEERYLAFVNNIENMTVFAKEGEVVWQCRNCGYIEIGKEAPEVCPACLHPQAYFEVKKENY